MLILFCPKKKKDIHITYIVWQSNKFGYQM